MFPDEVTSLNTLGFLVLFGTGLLMLILPRRYALLPIIIVTCFMTLGQVVMVGGLHFTMMRILVLFGWVRLFIRREFRPMHLNAVDKSVLAWAVVSIVTHSLLWQTSEEFINRLGFGYNVLGMYFLFRFLLRNLEDIRHTFAMMAITLLPLAGAMLVERFTERNVFAVFGGVRAVTELRGGTLRCQGPFGHPILAGTFGASLLPLMVSLWWQGRKYRWLAAAGVVSATVIVATSGSSGPLMAYMAGCLGLLMWYGRRYMRQVCWGILLSFFGLALVMKAPVWYLIQRVNIFSGSNGDHRALLIDQFVRHFADWWLLGVKSTIGWADENMWDITNQFVWEGVMGGLAELALFIAIIVVCFRTVGKAIPRLPTTQRYAHRRLVWALGATVFVHTTSFMSISYFDQNVINWYLLLALIATTAAIHKTVPVATSTVQEPSVFSPELDLAFTNNKALTYVRRS